MRNIIITIILFTYLPLASFAQTADKFNEVIKINITGDADYNLSINTDKYYFREMLIPLNIKQELTELKAENGFFAKQIYLQGINYIYIVKKDSTTGNKVVINGKIKEYFNFKDEKVKDFGNYSLNYRFINTKFNKINEYSIKIILPSKYNITSVDESIPEASEESVESPYILGKEDNNYNVTLRGKNLKLGENLYIKFRFKEGEKTYILGILLSVIAIGYLIIFRDLRKPKA